MSKSRNYLIYHYAPQSHFPGSPYSKALDEIDPAFYGSRDGGPASQYGFSGIKKSYFYAENTPQASVKYNAKCYEIYLPEEKKNKIYDIVKDVDGLYEIAKAELKKETKKFFGVGKLKVTEPQILQRYEELIKEKGYVGWKNNNDIALFEKISTKKPEGDYEVCHWNDSYLVQLVKSIYLNPSVTFQPATRPSVKQEQEKTISREFR